MYPSRALTRLLLLVLIFSPGIILAQAGHFNWFFGTGAGIDFSSGSPVAVTGGQTVTYESNCTISDTNGNLLFYTDGIDVWDSNHNLMPNGTGLLGDKSSRCLIVPRPSNPNNYYIFSIDEGGGPNGLIYSEVDMTLNGGFGDVNANKNVLMNQFNGEWLTAVPHANCIDIWLITCGHSSMSGVLAFLITPNGVNTTPVVSNLGLNIATGHQSIGLMKSSPQGNPIAMTMGSYANSVELIDFNNTNGTVNAFTNLYASPTGFDKPYGIEFSASGDVLYSADFEGDVYQYDLTAANPGATRTLIGSLSVSGEMGMLQRGPDGKIYCGKNLFGGLSSGANFLGVIDAPEVLGTGCNFIENGLFIGPGFMHYGLPDHYRSSDYDKTSLGLGPDQILCPDSSLTLSLPPVSNPLITYLWSDGSTAPTLSVSNSGTYWVEAQVGACPAVLDTIEIEGDPTQIYFDVQPIKGCAPLDLTFIGQSNFPNGITWWWDMGDGTQLSGANPSHQYSNPGVYQVSLSGISGNGCPLQSGSSGVVEVFAPPVADFVTLPKSIEVGNNIQFIDQSTHQPVSWFWELAEGQMFTDPEFSYSIITPGEYPVKLAITNAGGCVDTIIKTIEVVGVNHVYFPNAFTPDDDGINDHFKAYGPENALVELQVFNRWGDLVWRTSNLAESWDGTFRGSPAMSGVYVWQAEILVKGEKTILRRGQVNLIR